MKLSHNTRISLIYFVLNFQTIWLSRNKYQFGKACKIESTYQTIKYSKKVPIFSRIGPSLNQFIAENRLNDTKYDLFSWGLFYLFQIEIEKCFEIF